MLSLGTALGACFNPPAADVMFSCTPETGSVCPDGYACQADGCCHRAGSDVDANLGACGLGNADSATPTTGEPDTTDAPTTGTADTTATTSTTGTTDASGTTGTTGPSTGEPDTGTTGTTGEPGTTGADSGSSSAGTTG